MEQKKAFLKGVSDYFENMTRKDGSIFCKKDRIEHTGKNTYSVIIDSKLYELTGDEKYFQRARRRVCRILDNFIRDPDYGVFIFYPGRLNPRNAANTAIDGGGIADSLSFYLAAFKDKLNAVETEKIEDAIFKHSDEYLKNVCIEKPITNQRLWAATGLASAYNLFKGQSFYHKELSLRGWREALLRSIEISLAEQNPDGSFWYHPNYKRSDSNQHTGIADITPYYHSRHLTFIIHILEKINEPIDKYFNQIKKGADFLIGIYQPNGIKNINLEGKRWYWSSRYEVASHPFDIYLLTKMYQKTGDAIYKYYVSKSFEQLLKHQIGGGGIVSHFDSPRRIRIAERREKGMARLKYPHASNWQCRIFWSAHVAWVAKIILEIPSSYGNKNEEFQKLFREAGLFKFENDKYCLILRGKKKPMNIDFGGAVGGGSLLYFGQKENKWENEIKVYDWRPDSDNNFIAVPDEQKNVVREIKKFIKDNKSEFRGARWRFYVEFTGGYFSSAFKRIFKEIFWKLYQVLKNEYTSQWFTTTDLFIIDSADNDIKKIFAAGGLAKRDGRNLEGIKLGREYELEEQGFILKEKFESQMPLKSLKYIKNPKFKYLVKSNVKYRTYENYISFKCNGLTQIEITCDSRHSIL